MRLCMTFTLDICGWNLEVSQTRAHYWLLFPVVPFNHQPKRQSPILRNLHVR